MIKIGDTKWTKADDAEKIRMCDEWLEDAKQARNRREFEWYMNYMFLDGNHYIKYNTVTNALERPPRRKGEVRIAVNKIRSANRAIKNYSTRFEPKWEVVPGDIDPETITNARRAGKLLDYLYRKLHLEILIKGLVDTGLNTSIGWVELDWDENAADGQGEVKVILHDPFDIYHDKGGYLYGGKFQGRFICKTIQKSLAEVQADERYDKKARKKVQSDDELATSTMKARLIRKRQGPTEKKIKTVTVNEFYLYEDEENDENGNIRLFTYAGGQVLRDEELPDKEYPLYLFQIPQDPLNVYHRSWNADAIPLNKALDRTISQKVMYVNQALIYRIIAEKGHGANPITNDMGQILEINPGRKYKPLEMPSLPAALDSLNADMNLYLEDILSSHEASIGRMPTGARSGKTLEALQAAESNNLAGIRQSLESFLSILGKRILEIVADKYVASRVIKITEPETVGEESVNYLKVIGGEAPNKPEGATIVTGDNEVIVKIGSWLGYTREAQRETLMKLGELGVVPADEILRQFEFPNINELSAKARRERLEQHALKAEIAGRRGQQGGRRAAGGGRAEDEMVRLADQENTEMANGEALPPTEGATLSHTQGHMDFMRSRTFQEIPPENQQIIAQHTRGELREHGVGG